MGYESKIIIADRHIFERNDSEYVWGETIATFDLCKMGYDRIGGKAFPEIFTIPIDFNLYIDGDESKEDRYGEHCKYTDIDTVLAWLYEFIKDDPYRRVYPVLGCLEALKRDINSWVNLVVIHYGY